MSIQERFMSNRSTISTPNAPAAIGTYSQAVKVGNTVYISGQIPLIPETMELVTESFEAQAVQVFENLKAIAEAAGGSLNEAVKLTILLSDMSHFAKVNEVMARYFDEPYPARAAFAVKELPKSVDIEIDAIMVTAD
jgi:reactive intermediate/imine deaminase